MAKIAKNVKETWWQLFKTGTWKSNNGKEFSADEKTIDDIVSATANRTYANDEVPICIGHKKDNSPKWGAFKKDAFKRSGDFLLGKYEYLVNEFAEALDRKMFDKVSISLYPDNAIKHIAVLGVQAPAVKALGGIELSDDEEAAYEFDVNDIQISTWWFSGAVGVLRSIKNVLISKFGLEETEKFIPETAITNLADPPRIWQQNTSKYFNENNEGTTMPEETKKEVPAEFTEQLSAKDTEIANLKKKLADNAVREFCEGPDMAARITPALKPYVKEILSDLMNNDSQFEFQEGEGEEAKTVKITKAEAFKKILSALPEFEFAECATNKSAAGDKDNKPQYMKDGEEIASYANQHRKK